MKLALVVHILRQHKVKRRGKIQTETKRAKILFRDLIWFKCPPLSHLPLHFLAPWHKLPDVALSSLHVPLLEMSAPGLGTQEFSDPAVGCQCFSSLTSLQPETPVPTCFPAFFHPILGLSGIHWASVTQATPRMVVSPSYTLVLSCSVIFLGDPNGA